MNREYMAGASCYRERKRFQVIGPGVTLPEAMAAANVGDGPMFTLDSDFAKCEDAKCGSLAGKRLEKHPPNTLNGARP